MPYNRRAIDPEMCWPHLCSIGQALSLARETAQDYLEKAKGRNVLIATETKQAAEIRCQVHIEKCPNCVDRSAQAQARLRGRWLARRPVRQRLKPSRTGEVRPAIAPTANDSQVTYALRLFEGRVVS